MISNHETLNTLKLLGLNDYESKSYVALCSLVRGTASEISLVSQVPRSKIYEILKRLADKGFVEVERGKPIKFNVIPPFDVFDHLKEQVNKKLDRAEAELNNIYENQMPKIPAPVWIIHGQNNLIKKELEIFSRTKESIYIISGLMFEQEMEIILPYIKQLIKNGVEVKILIRPEHKVDGHEFRVDQYFSELSCDIKLFPIPYIKSIIRDNQEMLIAFCRIHDNNMLSHTAIGIWNQYPEFIETIRNFYHILWTNEPFKHL